MESQGNEQAKSRSVFVPLHLHSDASFLDGMSRPKILAARAKELGYNALALTDHGNVHNLVRLQQELQKVNIKLVPGCELYFTNRHEDKEQKSFHLTMLAKDNVGLKNLYKMLTWANIPVDNGGGFFARPRVSWRELGKYNDGLVCLTGCMKSPINQAFLRNGYEAGREFASKLVEVFGRDDVVVELQNVNDGEATYIPEQDKLLELCRRLAKDLRLESVATNDCHYVHREDEEAHEVLKCIGTGATLATPVITEDSPGGRIKFRGHRYHLLSSEEMLTKFSREEVEASIEIVERCTAEVSTKGSHMPKFDPSISPEQAYEKLVEEVKRGWKFWCMGEKENVEEYRERLRIELKDIKEAGLTDYFLIVWDVTKFIEENNIGRGFSRGSAGGSLVSYLLRVTLTDPIEHGLIWERFWNRGRKGSLPDIDIDVDPGRRDEIVEYLRNKFGRNKVFPMMTISKMTAKQAVKDAGRVVGLPFNYMVELCKHFPHKCKSIEDAVQRSSEIASAAEGEDGEVKVWKEEVKELRKRWKSKKEATGQRDFNMEGQVLDLQNRVAERSRKLIKTFRVAKRLENVARQRSRHACALLISDKPVFGRIPLTWDTKHKTLVTGWDMYDLDKMGYLKLDILGLANAAVVSRVLENGVYEIIEKGFDDPTIYELIGTGNCKGVFQLESHLGRQWARKMKPKNLEELAGLVSILRPAVLETGLATQYLNNRAAGKWTLMHKDLRPIFKKTYGIQLYQEQMLEVVRKFGGFDLAHADMVRKACGKKLPEEMAKHKKDFVDGCAKNGYDQSIADKLWEWIEAGASYSFNASHAFGYAMMSYATAWLKKHKPLHFFKALLQMSEYSPNPKDEVSEIFYDAKLFDVSIKGPSLKLGNVDFEVFGNEIRFGLRHIRGIGDATAEQVQKLRGASWGEVLLAEKRPKKPALRALIHSGALDYLGLTRMQLAASAEFVDLLTEREAELLKCLLSGKPAQMGKKVVDLGKAGGFRNAVEKIAAFLEDENLKLKAINKNRAEKLLQACASFLEQREDGEDNLRTRAGLEIYYLGIPATCSEVDIYDDHRRTHRCIDAKRATEGTEICTIAVLMDVSRRMARNKSQMAFIKVADKTYMLEGLMFEDSLLKYGDKLENGKVLLIRGVKRRGALIVDKVEVLE